MKILFYSFLSLFIFCAPANAKTDTGFQLPKFKLKGQAIQGGLMIGQTSPQNQVFLDERAIKLSKQGYFLLGFGRDYQKKAQLIIKSDKTRYEKIISVRQRAYDTQYIDNIDPDKITPPLAALAQIKSENRAKKKARLINYELGFFQQKFVWPVSGIITGLYGVDRVLNGRKMRPHYGIDIATKNHATIIAPAGGIVTLIGEDFYFEGGLVFLDHGFGLSSAFLHLSAIKVRVGQRLEQGDIIGIVGATGRGTGIHLDWRVKWRNQNLDPAIIVTGSSPANTSPDTSPDTSNGAKACTKGAHIMRLNSTCYAPKANGQDAP